MSSFDGEHEWRKRGYLPERLHPEIRSIFASFNSRSFLVFLEALTGINGLIPDPYYSGGGFHEILNGGFLDVHADFNLHPLLKVERRINVLLYLNRDWREEYGGALQLWANSKGPCIRKIVPEFNRCVIFNTTSSTYHGNPEPVQHPNGHPRRSIALYYYTATWSGGRTEHNTIFAEPKAGDTLSRHGSDAAGLRAGILSEALADTVEEMPGSERGATRSFEVHLSNIGTNVYAIPLGISVVRILSAAAFHGNDPRMLGAAITKIKVDGQAVPIADPSLSNGFYDLEREGQRRWRWTNGSAEFPIFEYGNGKTLEIEVEALSS
jgi:hypothetical protein